MPAKPRSASTVVHRLLFRALLEMRSRGQEQSDKVTFHLADLFHTVVLELDRASKGDCSYEDVLKTLSSRAQERGLDRWLTDNLDSLSELSTV